MDLSAEKDAEIGQDLFLRLRRVTQGLAKRHDISREHAADYLLAGALFTAADIYGLSIDETVAVMAEIAASVQEDVLSPATRH